MPLLMLLGCSDESQIFPLTEFTKVEEDLKLEYFVVANPPSDTTKLKMLITDFNRKTIDSSDFQKYDHIKRVFFRESSQMPRDYKEEHEGYFSKDYIEGHLEDMLFQADWFRRDSGELNFDYTIFDEDGFIMNKKVKITLPEDASD